MASTPSAESGTSLRLGKFTFVIGVGLGDTNPEWRLLLSLTREHTSSASLANLPPKTVGFLFDYRHGFWGNKLYTASPDDWTVVEYESRTPAES